MNRLLAIACVALLTLTTSVSAMLVEPQLNESFSTTASEFRVPAALDSSFGAADIAISSDEGDHLH